MVLTYNGASDEPTDAGTYEVTATVQDPNYSGSSTVMLVVEQAPVPVQINNLYQVYDGTPKAVEPSVQAVPASVDVTYDGRPDPPTLAGDYLVRATVTNAKNFTGSAAGTLSIAKANATVFLENLTQGYDGAPKPVATATLPAGLRVVLTYDDQNQAPSAAGTYAVVGEINDVNYEGSTMSWLTISSESDTGDSGQSVTLPVANAGILQPTTDLPTLVVSWPTATTNVMVWQSSDLSSWTPFPNVFGPGDFLFITPKAGALLYRATLIDPEQTNSLPLVIRRL